MQLVLSTEETVILRDLLSSYLPELQREVARTEQHALRHALVQRQELAERLLEQLAAQAA
jgi:FMN-dependent NADH-azoreductase